MIVEKILHNAQIEPEKTAITYRGNSISYSELAHEIDFIINDKDLAKKDINFIQQEPITALLHLLGFSAMGKTSIILPKDFTNSQRLDVLESVAEKRVPNAFLGVLSSGSTGKPKVIWKTNKNWEDAFKYQSDIFKITKNDNVFVLDALAYSANLNAALHTLWVGGTLVLGSLKHANSWNKQFEECNITSTFLVPSHCRLLTQKISEYATLWSIVTAGEKLEASLAKELMSSFPNACLTEYYGAAELGHITYQQNEAIIKYPYSVGCIFPEVQVTIKEDKITVKSPFVSPNYKSEGTVDDLGYFENDRLILKGRSGRMFNRRGLNIYAQEIEQIALQSGFIKRSVLVENRAKTKLTLYFIATDDSQELIERELSVFLKEKLPIAKHPSFVKKLREFPHSDAGKVDFKTLSKMSSEEKALII